MSASDVSSIDFADTGVAFDYRSTFELMRAATIFRSFQRPTIAKWGPRAVNAALRFHLPVKAAIRETVFRQFCGGESIEACLPLIRKLEQYGVGSILDYASEGEDSERAFAANAAEVKKTIEAVHAVSSLPISVFKMTGIARFGLLEKLHMGSDLSEAERREWADVRTRVADLCAFAAARDVPLMIDAEETWIQNPVDTLAEEMMTRHNRDGRTIVFTTAQMYRVDRLVYLRRLRDVALRKGFRVGVKLVRGAYMEKERARAAELGYPSPIQPDKKATDAAYDAALLLMLEAKDVFSFCAGTHNEASTLLLVRKILETGLHPSDPRVVFSQLYGMSDHLTFNLARHGYHAFKYLPYGPVKAVMPYLIRRAEENSAIAGQVGRELILVQQELKRRLAKKDSLSKAAPVTQKT